MDNLASSTATTEEPEAYYYVDEYAQQDEAAALPPDFEVYQGHGHRLGTTPKLDPEDALLLAVENFCTLKTKVPDAKISFLWETAQECVNREDSAMQCAEDLISTSDYPVEINGNPDMDDSDANFLVALKYSILKGIFPDAASSWLWDTAKDQAESSEVVFNQFVAHMQQTGDYPKCNLEELPSGVKIEVKKMELTRIAQEILHNIDPQHIEKQLNGETALGYNEQGVSQIILNCMSNAQSCPSITEEYYRKITQEAIEQYSVNFDVEKFLQRFPKPVEYFESAANPGGPKYRADVFKYLRTVAPQQTREYIERVQKTDKHLIKCHRRLFGNTVPIVTKQYRLTDECGRFIHELTYVRYYERLLKPAAIYASLLDCSYQADMDDFDPVPACCELCKENVPLRKIFTCTEAHMFCEDCVRSWVNDRLENAYVTVECMEVCQGIIPDAALAHIIPAAAMDRLLKRRQEQEVGQAQLNGIVNCMWCDYSYVPRTEDKDMVCLNPECGERWCKECSKLAHFPNPCEDTPEETRKRIFIEEKLTKATGRFCPQCGTFIQKVDGCDNVTCKCMASICYNCGQLSTHHHCPNPRATFNVRAAGQEAKVEAEQRFPNVRLNYDPTRLH